MDTTAEQQTPREEAAKDQPREGAAPPAEGPATKAQDRSARAAVSTQIDDVVAAVRRLEAFAADEAKRVSGKLVPQIEHQAKQNIWVSLLLALGLGMILGIWLTGGRRRD